MTSPWTASTLAYIHRWRCSMRCCKRSIDINQDIRLATLGMSCQWEIQDPKMYCTTEDFWWGYLHSSYTGLIQSSIIFYIHIYIYTCGRCLQFRSLNWPAILGETPATSNPSKSTELCEDFSSGVLSRQEKYNATEWQDRLCAYISFNQMLATH